MSGSESAESPELVTAQFGLTVLGERIETSLSVPRGAVSPDGLLPLARGLTDRLVEIAVRVEEREGRSISCRAGCAACCRQLVPVTEAEARRLAQVIEAMPEPNRTRTRDRFQAARDAMEGIGMLNDLRDDESRSRLDAKDRLRIGARYFAQQIPCPFLDENESCGIYEERPIACRTHLVTSPAEECSRPEAKRVAGVHVPSAPHVSLAKACAPNQDGSGSGNGTPPWVALSLVDEWAEAHPEPSAPRPGPEALRDFIQAIARGSQQAAGVSHNDAIIPREPTDNA